jgi:Skp family chaperone for outer membrane proteins
LKKVAKRLNYTIILKDAAPIGYLDPSVDITDEVIKELNKK